MKLNPFCPAFLVKPYSFRVGKNSIDLPLDRMKVAADLIDERTFDFWTPALYFTPRAMINQLCPPMAEYLWPLGNDPKIFTTLGSYNRVSKMQGALLSSLNVAPPQKNYQRIVHNSTMVR